MVAQHFEETKNLDAAERFFLKARAPQVPPHAIPPPTHPRGARAHPHAVV